MSLFCPKDDAKKFQEMFQQYQAMKQQQAAGLAGQLTPALWYDPRALQNAFAGIGEPEKPVRPLPEEMVVSALVGWRRWTVTLFGSVLHSNNGTKWTPFQKLEADCARGHKCGGVSCGCGIYAYKTREQLKSGPNASKAIHELEGEVWLWGRIVECEKGFRAQFAYPKSFARSAIAETVASTYKVTLID